MATATAPERAIFGDRVAYASFPESVFDRAARVLLSIARRDPAAAATALERFIDSVSRGEYCGCIVQSLSHNRQDASWDVLFSHASLGMFRLESQRPVPNAPMSMRPEDVSDSMDVLEAEIGAK